LGIKFKRIRLRAQIPGRILGFDAAFPEDMIIIRGANTVGKSLLLQSMLYGLGMEDLFASRAGSLTRAMSSSVDIDGGSYPVLRSYVEVVVENADGQVLTIRRIVRPGSDEPTQASQLVRVWDGDLDPDHVDAQTDSERDFYVSRPGGAADESGFHHFLVDFLGWQGLPLVPTYSENYAPLYLQVMFGLAYVEQKRGWGGTVPQVPTRYRIIEPLRRAVEFALNLDLLGLAAKRRQLDEDIRRLASHEARLRDRLKAAASVSGGRVAFPAIPNPAAKSLSKALDGVDPDDVPQVEVLSGTRWIDVQSRVDEIDRARADRALLGALAAPLSAAPERVGMEEELRVAEGQLGDTSARLAAVNQSEDMLHIQLGALSRRIGHVDEEVRKYGQIRTLANLGSALAESALHEGDCPTCRQPLEGIESVEGNALGVEETRAALSEERSTLLGLMSEAERAIAGIDVQRNALSRQATDLRGRVRALKNDLVSPDSVPSIADLQRAVAQEAERGGLLRLQSQVAEDLDEWGEVRMQLAASVSERIELGPADLSVEDRAKLMVWEQRLRWHLNLYRFESASSADIEIDEAMRPVVEGYDIAFQGSASDAIRLRWAYLLSLFEVSVAEGGHHPGFVMFDEPGQQGVEEESLRALYRACIDDSGSTGQVFLTTSLSGEILQSWLDGQSSVLIDVGSERLLRDIGAS
jgi:hypothetical protein